MATKLHPNSRWIFRFQFLPALILPVSLILFSRLLASNAELKPGNLGEFANLLAITALVLTVLIIIFSEIFARLSYNNYNYEIKENEIKIHKGIIWKTYGVLPYRRVQNIVLRRGIIARIFGISTIQIETAGNSAIDASEGYLPGVDIRHAEEIRDYIMSRVSKDNSGKGL